MTIATTKADSGLDTFDIAFKFPEHIPPYLTHCSTKCTQTCTRTSWPWLNFSDCLRHSTPTMSSFGDTTSMTYCSM